MASAVVTRTPFGEGITYLPPTLPAEDLLNLGLVHVGDEWNPADVGGLVGQAGQVVTRNMLQRELPADADELAEAALAVTG